MSNKVIRLTESELIGIINNTVARLFEEYDYPRVHLFPVDEEQLSLSLMEGLMFSYPLEKVVPYLMKTFSLDGNMNSYLSGGGSKNGVVTPMKGNNGTDVIMVAIRKYATGVYEQLKDTMNNLCGWQLSCIVNDTPSSRRYPKWFIDYHYVLQFEKRIDDDATVDVFKQRYIYHVCPTSRLGKIMHIGLSPRDSTWGEFKHKGRIYFYLEIPNLTDISREFSMKNVATDGYNLLAIDVSLIDKETKFFYDPRQPGGVITTDNIPPKAIKVLQ